MDASLILKTGTPGAGKTLHTVYEVDKLAKETKRPVYYHGIKGLALDWVLMESAEDWIKCPTGSIIVIDECQSAFRPRGAGTKVPEYIAKFETHRHDGYTIFLITQHPMLVDQNIRRLVNKHVHVVRKFGEKKATLHQWGSMHEITKTNLASALQIKFQYPADYFEKYQSAEVHNIKKKLPARVYFLYASPVIVIALLWFAWSKITSVGQSPDKPAASVFPSASTASASPSQQARPGSGMTTEAYILAMTPRLPGMPWTAPAYDEVTQPVEAPYPVACIEGSKGCRCYDQQQARIAVSETFCRDYLDRGMFVPWKQNTARAGEIRGTEDRKQARRADSSVAGG